MDTLYSLRLFVGAAEARNFSAAARKFGISTATVSRSIDSLEKHLGFQLFLKTSRQIGLTEAGECYLRNIQRILPEFDNAMEFAKGFHSEAKGHLKVRARMAVGSICIAPLIPKFLSRYPDIELNFWLTNDLDTDLVSKNIDVDIRTGVLQDSSLIARKLADSKRLIAASPEYLEKHGTPQTPYDLENHNCIRFMTYPSPVHWRFKHKEGLEIGIAPKGNLVTNNGAVIRRAARSGIGIAHLTDWSVAKDVKAGTLVQILADYDVTVDTFNHGIYALFLPNRTQSHKVRCFVDFLVEGLRQQSSDWPSREKDDASQDFLATAGYPEGTIPFAKAAKGRTDDMNR